jgi:hypothetical protein
MFIPQQQGRRGLSDAEVLAAAAAGYGAWRFWHHGWVRALTGYVVTWFVFMVLAGSIIALARPGDSAPWTIWTTLFVPVIPGAGAGWAAAKYLGKNAKKREAARQAARHVVRTQSGAVSFYRAPAPYQQAPPEPYVTRIGKSLAETDPGPADKAQLDAHTLALLPLVALLGGYAAEAPIAVGERYDVRFLNDRLVVCAPRGWHVLAEVHYNKIENLEIGGPGLVKSGGGFIGGGFGVMGALEGMGIAAVLNALTTSTKITTVIWVQATDCELFLLWNATTPEQLRIDLSRPLGAVRAARTAANYPRTASASQVTELSKLADMLQAGMLSREDSIS